MNRKKIIRKILIIAAGFLVISGISTLLVAANDKQREHVCRELSISIQGTGDKFYIQKDDIKKQIERTANGSLIQRPVTSIDLGRLERALKTNPWIYNAQLYFNSKDILNVNIKEREPIARIFTAEGNSFYLDSTGQRMPLLEKISVRVPAVTGFTTSKKLNTRDSALLKEVTKVSGFIYTHQFWNEQIGEINITGERKFELTPVIGDHIIEIGNSENIDAKLNRLYVFYKQVMNRTGFNKYAALNLEYDGQVIAVKKGPMSVIDSVQLKKNIDDLLRKTSIQNAEEGISINRNEHSTDKQDSALKNINQSHLDTVNNQSAQGENQSNSAKTTYQSKPEEEPGKKEEKRKPKAVMKKLNH